MANGEVFVMMAPVRQKGRQRSALVFLHIPKAGGTTLHRIIERQYPKEAIFSIDGNRVKESIEDLKNLSSGEKARIRCLKGHMWFGLHRNLPMEVMYITMLRNPIDRLISHYHFVLETPNHYLHERIISTNMDLEEYVSSDLAQELNNWQVKAVSGVEEVIQGYESASTNTLEVAKRNLQEHFIAVGLLEQFDESLVLFKKLLGWKNICYVRQNITQERPSRKDIPPRVVRRIEEHNELDLELYSFVKDLFAERLLEENLTKSDLLFHLMLNRVYQRAHALVTKVPARHAT